MPGTEKKRAQDRERMRAKRSNGGWRDIETAPKDGTSIWAYCTRMKECGEVRWVGNFGEWGATWVMAGFNQPWAAIPTHWMPMPNPPPSKAQKDISDE